MKMHMIKLYEKMKFILTKKIKIITSFVASATNPRTWSSSDGMVPFVIFKFKLNPNTST